MVRFMKQLTYRPLAEEFALGATGPGAWQARVDRTWRGWTGPHGGVIAALLVDVARRAADEELPVRAVDLRFLGRPVDGAFAFSATARPLGRGTAIVDVVARQESGEVAAASITLGRTAPSSVPDRTERPAPEVAAADACAAFRLPPEIVPVGAHFDIRPAAGPLPLTGAVQAWMCAWIALNPPMITDAATLAILADALPPGIFPTLSAPIAVPTVAFSMHLHTDFTAPAGQPVLVRAANTGTGGGWSVDDVDIWDAAGRLLVSARQTRRVLG
ncbi:acyl-CoA thioesterase [Nocardia bhagyanarayanae]|uniref:Acyl-CoA thioesterase n=2 Tax=Nocardia bhagyanarayanae TaxID=1215925 RepID=A0A543FGX1_9NOCA|nr:acyl-CoA thioesterase [Nocardia bhagyanarayanae]